MKYPDKNSFGKTPDHFTQNLLKALQQEEKTMKKKSFATLMIAALITLMIAATALAVARRAGLLEFFQDEDDTRNPNQYEHQLGKDGVLLSETYGDLEITVTEGAGAQGHYVMVNTVALKEGAPGVLESPLRRAMEVVEGIDPVLVQAEDGEPVYHIICSVVHETGSGEVEGALANEDGSFSFKSELNRIMETANTTQMYCVLAVVKQEAGQPAQDAQTEIVYFPFTVQVEEALDARSLESPVEIAKAAVTLDALYLKQAGSGTFANLYFQYDGGVATDYTSPDQLYISLLDEDGKSMLGENNYFTGVWTGENRYAARIPLNIENLPDKVTVLLHDWDMNALGSAEVSLTKKKSLPTIPEEYAPLYPPIDYRNVEVPNNGSLPNHAFTSVSQGEEIPMLRVPGDDNSTICNLASGMQVEVYAEFNDWTLVGFGELFAYGSGFVQKSQLVETQSEAQAGVLRAGINVQTEARYAPDAKSTITQRFGAGQAVLVLGEKADWCYVIADTGKAGGIMGYVPKETVTESGERLTVWLADIAAESSYGEP